MAQKKAVILLLMLTLLLFASLQLPAAAAPTIKRPMDFYEATIEGGSPQTVDYSCAYDTASSELIQNTMDTLIMFNGEHTDQFMPGIATSWTITQLNGTSGIMSSDPISGLVFENSGQPGPNAIYYYRYDFRIRPSVFFQPPYNYSLTPEDVAYSFQRTVIQGRNAGPQWMIEEPLLDINAGDVDVNVYGLGADLTNSTQVALMGALIRDMVQYNVTDIWFNVMFPGAYAPFLQILCQTWSSIESKQWINNQVITGAGRHDWPGDWTNVSNWIDYRNPSVSPLDSPTPMEYGSGPFTLTAVDNIANYWAATRHVAYWCGWPASFPMLSGATPAGYVNTIEVTWNFDWTTRKTMFLAGDVDFCAVPIQNFADVYQNATPPFDPPTNYPLDGIRCIHPVPELIANAVFLNFNITQGNDTGLLGPAGVFDPTWIPYDFFGNAAWGINVRKAFAEAFDYATYVSTVFSGEAVTPTPATAIIPGLNYYDPTVIGPSYNLAAANASFNAVPGLSTTGFTINLVYNTGNTPRYEACLLLKTAIESLNPLYHCNIVAISWHDYLVQLVYQQLPCFIIGWWADIPDPHDFAVPFYHTGGAFAAWQAYSNSTMDSWIDQAINTPNGPARALLYKQVQQGAVDDCPSFIIDQPVGRHFERDWINGWYYNAIYNAIYPGICFYNLWKSYAGSTRMSVYPSSIVVPPGGNITVAVTVAKVVELYAWQVAFKYNASVVNCSAAWIPDNNVFQGKTTNQTGLTINAPTTDGLNYTLIGLSLLSGYVNVSSGTLFSINFKAIGEGETTILIGTRTDPITSASGNWSSFLQDPSANEISFVKDDGQASVGGENVTIFPITNLGLTFANVTGAGSVTANETPTVQAPILNNTLGPYYDVKVTASYSGNVTVSLAYDDSNMTLQQEGNLQMVQYTPIPGDIREPFGMLDIRDISHIAKHFGTTPASPNWDPIADVTGPTPMVPDGKVDIKDISLAARNFGKIAYWINITMSVDTANNIIYGETTHFSLIGIH